MASELKKEITDAVKTAMRAKDKPRLGVLRMVTSEIKRIEVDERIDVSDERLLVVLDKMIKQRRDASTQYTDAGREDLATIENFEISVIQEFMPSQLEEAEIAKIIADAVEATGASSMADMGKLMGAVKPQVQGRCDMGAVSKLVKSALS